MVGLGRRRRKGTRARDNVGPAMSMIELNIGGAAARLDAGNPRVTIGRDEFAVSLPCPDPSVSRQHCEVWLDGANAMIRDMGSSNGTWVDGQPVGQQPVALRPGQTVFVGHLPLAISWKGGPAQGATVMGALPAELLALMNARKAQAQVKVIEPPPRVLEVGGAKGPAAAEMAYRRQGSNNNGVLLVALPGDTFTNNSVLDGFVEFTALDDETVSSITVELVEVHRKGAKKGHVWDRMLVKQGPWKCKKNNVVPMEFQLRVPNATSITGKDVYWEIRGAVDIAWGYDIEVEVPITMRNSDIERIRDALGALDYRVVDLESKPLGQEFLCKFQPPTQWRSAMGIDSIDLKIQYLGANLQVNLEVDKKGTYSGDRRTEFNLELEKLRTSTQEQISQHFHLHIDRLMRVK
jgi:hypothetical protein